MLNIDLLEHIRIIPGLFPVSSISEVALGNLKPTAMPRPVDPGPDAGRQQWQFDGA